MKIGHDTVRNSHRRWGKDRGTVKVRQIRNASGVIYRETVKLPEPVAGAVTERPRTDRVERRGADPRKSRGLQRIGKIKRFRVVVGKRELTSM